MGNAFERLRGFPGVCFLILSLVCAARAATHGPLRLWIAELPTPQGRGQPPYGGSSATHSLRCKTALTPSVCTALRAAHTPVAPPFFLISWEPKAGIAGPGHPCEHCPQSLRSVWTAQSGDPSGEGRCGGAAPGVRGGVPLPRSRPSGGPVGLFGGPCSPPFGGHMYPSFRR